MDLTNASAIVTGGAGGFGSATVRRLAQKGAKVVIADVSDERGEARAREAGAGSLYVPTDCMDEGAIAKAARGRRRPRAAARLSTTNATAAKVSDLSRREVPRLRGRRSSRNSPSMHSGE
jgi:NAD(P)-dependent dehydrogenase (short-subunit alcohol dehydrogenase family)